MLEGHGRYARLEKATHVLPDGRVVVYARRRLLPQGARLPLLAEVVPNGNERLDQLAGRVLGDPEMFWRICDANDAMSPSDVPLDGSRSLRIPFPEAI